MVEININYNDAIDSMLQVSYRSLNTQTAVHRA
jgi:hypothetical protein